MKDNIKEIEARVELIEKHMPTIAHKLVELSTKIDILVQEMAELAELQNRAAVVLGKSDDQQRRAISVISRYIADDIRRKKNDRRKES